MHDCARVGGVRPGWSVCRSLLLLVAMAIPAAAAPVEPQTNIPPNRLSFTMGGGTFTIPYARNHPLGSGTNTFDRAVVVIHGLHRNAINSYENVEDVAVAETVDDTTLIVAPQFLRMEDLAPNSLSPTNMLYWSGGWSTGYESQNTNTTNSVNRAA